MPHESRFAFIDLLRIIAAQVIVLHHLAFYGPLSDHAYPLAASPIDWLYQYGRLAVQVFFVTGGYCLAGSLARRKPSRPLACAGMVIERYFRIGLPYLAALVVALVANEVARSWMAHPSISASPTPGQLVAHVFLLHKVLGYESLTAGIWYVAIDVQLVALVSLVYAVACRLSSDGGHAIARWTLLAMGLVSAFFWNRSPDLDRFGIYFLASYMLGMLAAVTAALLVLAQGQEWLARFSSLRPFKRLGLVTYSLFLVHFPICLVINAWWSYQVPPNAAMALLGMAFAWGLSMAAAFAFYHVVETRLARLRIPGTGTRKPLPDRSAVVRPIIANNDSWGG